MAAQPFPTQVIEKTTSGVAPDGTSKDKKEGRMFGFGAQELFVVMVMFIFVLPFIIYEPICIGLISKKLGFNPWLMELLCLIPVVNLVVLGVLAFSKERKTAA